MGNALIGLVAHLVGETEEPRHVHEAADRRGAMISGVWFARALVLSALALSVTTAFGREAVEDALGGPIIECAGAIAWIESDSDVMRVEPMRLAAPEAEGADRVALYLSEDDFSSDNVWACMDGSCNATRTLHSTITVNALRLRHETDLGNGEAVYGTTSVYVVVNARENPIEVVNATGTGAFLCEKGLPKSLTSSGE